MSQIHPDSPTKTNNNKSHYKQFRSRYSAQINADELNKKKEQMESSNRLQTIQSENQLITQYSQRTTRSIQGQGLELLMNCQGLFISQQIQIWELVSGLDFPLNYYIYPADEQGELMKDYDPIFLSTDRSNICTMLCQTEATRSLQINVYNYKITQNDTLIKENRVLEGKKEADCAILCLPWFTPRKPFEIVIPDKDGNKKLIGRIEFPHKPSNLLKQLFEIKDDKGQIQYVISQKKCQLGYICRGCLTQTCKKSSFEIFDANNQFVSRFFKYFSNMVSKPCGRDRDDISVIFPAKSNIYQRALLMISLIVINNMLFQESPMSRNRNLD